MHLDVSLLFDGGASHVVGHVMQLWFPIAFFKSSHIEKLTKIQTLISEISMDADNSP